MKQNQDFVKDLKSSHFDFGGYNTKPSHSQYRHHYRSNDDPNFKPTESINLHSIRGSHLQFGDYKSDNFYTTSKDHHYGNPGVQPLAKINDDK